MRAFFLVILCCFPALAGSAPGGYEASIETWRTQREQKLKAPDGWLTVAGLFWLKEGENRAGSDPNYEIVLPEGRSPRRLGVFDFHDGKTHFRIASGAHVTVNGKPILTADLASDDSGRPDLLQSGDFTMFVIKRGPKYGIRLRDLHSSMRNEFHGLEWYPVEPKLRIVANFTAHPAPTTIPIPNILGQTEQQQSPGYATFQIAGKTYRLDPVLEDNQLFFIFRDTTAGKTTYGAGRFLYADPPKDGKVILDFNKAYNPPCAFTPYATCPLPPKQNRLAVAIEAGEKKYGNH
jgi:uncharacterized protein (DUF1684 family)